jgi:hypothetical protein
VQLASVVLSGARPLPLSVIRGSIMVDWMHLHEGDRVWSGVRKWFVVQGDEVLCGDDRRSVERVQFLMTEDPWFKVYDASHAVWRDGPYRRTPTDWQHLWQVDPTGARAHDQ